MGLTEQWGPTVTAASAVRTFEWTPDYHGKILVVLKSDIEGGDLDKTRAAIKTEWLDQFGLFGDIERRLLNKPSKYAEFDLRPRKDKLRIHSWAAFFAPEDVDALMVPLEKMAKSHGFKKINWTGSI